MKKGKNSKKVCAKTGDTKTNSETAKESVEAIETAGDSTDNGDNNEELGKCGDDQELSIGKSGENEGIQGSESEVDEEWELTKIMPITAITHPCPIKCSHDTCALVAVSVWVSNQKPDEKWYSCLDCQVR
jgi:hypothetical protein